MQSRTTVDHRRFRYAQSDKPDNQIGVFRLEQLVQPKGAKPRSPRRAASEVDGLDLKTYRNNAFGAHQQALKQSKYTVILFDVSLCTFCEKLIGKLSDKRFVKYSDRLIVSVTRGDVDEGARQLEEALGVVRYPTLVILKTNNKNIHVAGRIEGNVSIPEIDRVLRKATEQPIRKK